MLLHQSFHDVQADYESSYASLDRARSDNDDIFCFSQTDPRDRAFLSCFVGQMLRRHTLGIDEY